MKFSLAGKALALAATVTLASCGAGGKATFPINVTVLNVLYPGLVLTTNGMEQTVAPPAKNADGSIPNVTFVFPNQIEYGQTYDVIPKGATATALGAMPAHQSCGAVQFPKNGTAGQLSKIDIYYSCTINAYALSGTIKGLTTTGLVLANGSNSTYTASPVVDANNKPTGADLAFALSAVPYANTYGVTVLTQPTGQTCTVAGGANGTGAGTMDDAAEKANGVTNLVVTCK
ncbi:hypothetical protein [uncultured Massilia sp.]|uniref:hypothetical protein n=1 Tax=uncultured Massilia sp. TaxID=169973 RepID=UPI0025F9866D|nr:hypothetical protein [uncultured Massilia sp.]